MKNQSQRFLDSLAAKFQASPDADCLLLKAPSDIGVRRNLGRNGARYAPEVVESALKKMNNHMGDISIHAVEVSSQAAEKKDYEAAIQESAQLISQLLQSQRAANIHLGGGHDHALPMLRALDGFGQKTLIINFDAHCDTRVDSLSHSGTPFRDFDREAQNQFHLVQIGIHPFANSAETLSPLARNTEKIYFGADPSELRDPQSFVDEILSGCPFKVGEDTNLFISLDCDALSSSVMSAVSAVNHHGISPERLLSWMEILKDFPSQRKVLGIYEYNPVYEDLSLKGARFLAGLIYKYLS